MMTIEQLTEKPKSFPLLEKLIFSGCLIKDANLLRFDEWCPNVTQLVFYMSTFSKETYNVFMSTESALVHVKSLAFHFRAGMKLSREFLATIDKKFPSLENLHLVSVAADFGLNNNSPYKPLYLKKLKNLSVNVSLSTRNSDDVNDLFDFMAISNENLKCLEFTSTTFPEKIMKWVESCENLKKLSLNCDNLCETDLIKMTRMASLEELKLEVERFRWKPKEMIEFTKIHPRLKAIDMRSGRSIIVSSYLSFNEQNKKDFKSLAKERRKLMFKVEYLEDGLKLQISEKGEKKSKGKPKRSYDHLYDD